MKIHWIYALAIVSVFISLAVTLLPKDKDAVGGLDEDPNHENDFIESRGYAPDHFKVGAI